MDSEYQDKSLFRLQTYNRIKKKNPQATDTSIATFLGMTKQSFYKWRVLNTEITQPEQRSFKPGRRRQGRPISPMKVKRSGKC